MKILYWHLTPQEVNEREYPQKKLVHWEIRSYFSRESYFSVFWFKHGIVYDKEPLNGVAMYGVECDSNTLDALETFLHERFGGEIVKRGHRRFFNNARVKIDNRSIAEIAIQLDKRFNCVSEIWLEFDGLDENEAKGLFSKSLQIEK